MLDSILIVRNPKGATAYINYKNKRFNKIVSTTAFSSIYDRIEKEIYGKRTTTR